MQENLKVDLIEKELVDIDLIEKELISINLVEKITTPIDVSLVEKELVNVNLVDKELINIILNAIDVLPGQKADLETVIIYFILNETPVNVNPLPSKRFRVVNAFVDGKLMVYLNGQKIHSSEITLHSDTEFSFPIDIITFDKVECVYIKK